MLRATFAAAVLLASATTEAQTINHFAGGGMVLGDGGPASAAGLNIPLGVASDAAGNVFIADNTHSRIRRVSAGAGIITTIAGTGVFGYSGDGGPGTSAMIFAPIGIATDGAGNVFFTDTSNNRIRRISAATGVITTVAGNGSFGYTGDFGPATSARLGFPEGVAVAPDGDIYIADTSNFAIRRVDAATGGITTVGGIALADPRGVAVDAEENIYVLDVLSSSRVYKRSAGTGIWSLVAGGGPGTGESGPPTLANLGVAVDVAVDNQGRLLIAGARRVWRADLAANQISVVAGTGASGNSGDGGDPLLATFTQLGGVGAGPDGSIYISDAAPGANRVRVIGPPPPPPPGPEPTLEPFFSPRSTPVQVGPPSGAPNDRFGGAVSIDGDTLVVGAEGDDIGGNADQGSAHVYRWNGAGWVHEAVLTASDGTAGDAFGASVAIDGDTIIVGAPMDDTGAAYIFTRSGAAWTERARLAAADGLAGDDFGRSVSIWADTVVVGAPLADLDAHSDRGCAYVFTRTGSMWAQQARLTASDGAADDQFGNAVAVWGDTAVVGSSRDDAGAAADRGSAYVFARNGSAWMQQAQLTALDGAAGDFFGRSVSIWADSIAIGAPGDDIGAGTDQGSVYVFTRAGAAWGQQAKVTASPGTANADMGCSVSIRGDTLAAGASLESAAGIAERGAVYIFTRSGSVWTQQGQLTAPDGAELDAFGRAIALWGDTVVVGAVLDDVGGESDRGSAWVFSRLGTWWIGADAVLVAADWASRPSQLFGGSIAIHGDTLVVGAEDVILIGSPGAAYVFVRSGSQWTQQARLTASDGSYGNEFGTSVSIHNDTIVVGARQQLVNGAFQGAAYVFVRSGITWTQQSQLIAWDAAAGGDLFGHAVAVDGTRAVVSATRSASSGTTTAGAVYVFARQGASWTADTVLVADDPGNNDRLGSRVALSGGTVVAGAPNKVADGNTNAGAAYVFARIGTVWSLQSRLTEPVPAQNNRFGSAVAIDGGTVLIGARGNASPGAVYVFERSGNQWNLQTSLTSPGSQPGDWFGEHVSFLGEHAIVSARYYNTGGAGSEGALFHFARVSNQWLLRDHLTGPGGISLGSASAVAIDERSVAVAETSTSPPRGTAYVLDVSPDGLALAANDSLNTGHTTLAAALLGAQSGHQITATQQAWADIGSLDTLGRSLGLNSTGDLRTPSTSTLTLGGSSYLAAAPGQSLDIFGHVRSAAGASADLIGSTFSVGSRGMLTARTNSSLTIHASEVCFDGPVRVEQGAALNLIGGGGATVIAPATFLSNSSMIADGPFVNSDTFNMSGGGLAAPLFWNRSGVNIFGSTAQFGDYWNESGATTTIRSGTLYIFGSFYNNGTIIGPVCSGCLGGPLGLEVTGSLVIGPDADLLMIAEDATVIVGGDFDCAINSNTRFNLAGAVLRMEGPGAERTLEVMSRDIGPIEAGLDNAVAGQYPLGHLVIGPSPTVVRLVDEHDNENSGQSACEAVYVDTLHIYSGSRLINPACKVYYNTLINHGVVDEPGNLVQIAPPCRADFDGDGVVGVPDIFAFLTAWFAGDFVRADFNEDGFLNVSDIFAFLTAWFAGCG